MISGIHRTLRRLCSLFRRDALDHEMEDELRFHLEVQARENAADGVPTDEAAHLARRQFGHVETVKETIRAHRGVVWLEHLARELRFALRSLRRSPGYSLAVVVILATAIGLVTAVVNVSRVVLVPAMPFPEPARLVVLRERQPGSHGFYSLSHRVASYAERTQSLTALAAERAELMNLVVGEEAQAARVSCVTEHYFAVLGAACRQGRAFRPEEHLPDASAAVVVLTDQAWKKYFGRDPTLLGREVMLGEQFRRVIGILPPTFATLRDFTESDGIYLAWRADPTPFRGQNIYVRAIGRLNPGITLEQAQGELRTIHPEGEGSLTQLEPFLTPLRDVLLERGTQPFRIFLGAVSLLYLIGGTAVANLMLSRGVARQRETGVRLALGGGRRRIATFVLGEALMLSLLAGAGGALVAWWAQRALAHLLPAGVPADELQSGVGFATIAIAVGLGLFTCVLAALAPAWRASRASLNEALKERAGAKGESRRVRTVRSTLVVLQAAFAVALLIGAGLMIESVHRLQHIELGFDPANKVVLTGTRRNPPDRTTLGQRNDAIIARIAALPEITHAAQSSTSPLAVGFVALSSYAIEGRDEAATFSFYRFVVSADFFTAMDLPLLAGRDFKDVRAGDPPVAIIDDVTARQLFPGENPVGQILRSQNTRIEIIGVVRSIAVGFRGGSAMSVSGHAITAQLYLPQVQGGASRYLSAILRLEHPPGPALAATVRKLAYDIDPTMVVSLRPLEEFLAEQMRGERHTRTMLQVLSVLALLLAAFGLFSVMAYNVAQRRGEFGLRMALGATPRRLLALVIKRGLLLATGGVLLGVAAAAGLARFLRSLLYETNPYDPAVYLGVAGLLLLVAALACWLPAWRAAKIDPATALRAE